MIYQNASDIKENYNAIIIGGGLSGMTAANILAKKFKHKILLIEQNNKLGGLATSFKRNGHKFNISLHGFPFAMIKTLRKYWSSKIAEKVIKIKKTLYINPQFLLETNFEIEDFQDKLINYFNIPRYKVLQFFDAVNNMEYYHDNSLTTYDFFNKYFNGRNDVIRFLMEPITYANGSDLDDPAITYGIVFSNFMNKGIFTFNTSIDNIILEMQNELINNNVDILFNSLAEKILIENNSVIGCKVKDRNIKSTSVISNINLIKTIKSLIGENYFTESYINNFNKVRVNNSSTQVYIGLKNDFIFKENTPELIFYSEENEFCTKKIYAMNTKSKTFSFYFPSIMNDMQKPSIVESKNALYDNWAKMSEKEYLASKEKLIQSSINVLEKIIPNIKNKIEYIEAATPKTFEKYTLHEKGASFGTKYEGLRFSLELSNQINGLFHTGSVGIIMSGWLGVINYGVITANKTDKFLKNEYNN